MPNRAEKGWSLWDLVRGGWNIKEGPSSPTPESNPPIRPGQGKNLYISRIFN